MEPMGAQAAVITHPGVVEVEAALDNKPTPHFSMPVVLALHSQNTQIISGEGHHVSQAAPIFDQRDQTVTTQYNAAGDINVGAMKTVDELVTALDALKLDLRAAHDDGAISELVEAKTKTPLLEAIEEAKKPEPDKNKVLAFLDSAKLALGGVAAVGAIVDSIGKIYEWVKQHTL
ncbi:hypothetical protein CCAX7_14920 [Capsulimonas corticalis]|uniref:Uncharacterized protein n=2 Tax=Capsulimonas corticalis TaxID=2219043 RepID=A0A402CZC8_9BACT|nr:hypothetical protein CCAX7_14920 [Capsulimonas corticalis]